METKENSSILDKTTIIAKRNKLEIWSTALLVGQSLLVWFLVWYASRERDFTFLLVYLSIFWVSIFGLIGYFKLFKLWREGRNGGYKINFVLLTVLLLLCVTVYKWSMGLYVFLQQWYPEAPFGGL